jgi:Ca2+-binding EF-hand superfamily protein
MSDLPSLLLFFMAAAYQPGTLQAPPAHAYAQTVAEAPAASADFAKLDVDGDGYITRKEAQKDAEVLRTFRRADVNKDGKLSQREFATAQLLSRIERPNQYLKARVAAK